MITCPECGQQLHVAGPQQFVVRGVEVDLAHCVTPDCPEFEKTRSYNERPMPPEVAAAARAALLQSVAEHGARRIA